MNIEDIEIKREPRVVFMGTPTFSVPVLEALAKNYKVKAIMVYDSADYALAGNTYSLEFSKDKIKKVGFNPLYKYVDDFDWEVKVPGSAGIIQFNNLETSMIKLTFNEEVSISEIVVVGEGD